jgi:hypothetical protein
LPYLIRVHSAAPDKCHVLRFTRQDGGTRKIPDIGGGGGRADILLPMCRELADQVERLPAETWRHAIHPREESGGYMMYCRELALPGPGRDGVNPGPGAAFLMTCRSVSSSSLVSQVHIAGLLFSYRMSNLLQYCQLSKWLIMRVA